MPRTKRSKYSEELIKEFIEAVLTNGGNIEATARRWKIPATTAKQWVAKRPFASSEVVDKCRENYILKCNKIALKILRQFERKLTKIEPEKLRAYNAVLKTVTESMATLSTVKPTAGRAKKKRAVSQTTSKLLTGLDKDTTTKQTVTETVEQEIEE